VGEGVQLRGHSWRGDWEVIGFLPLARHCSVKHAQCPGIFVQGSEGGFFLDCFCVRLYALSMICVAVE
jgi:hypothetical protein